MICADAKCAGNRKQGRNKLSLVGIDLVLPWKGLMLWLYDHLKSEYAGLSACVNAARTCRWAAAAVGRIAVRDDHSAPVCRLSSGAYS